MIFHKMLEFAEVREFRNDDVMILQANAIYVIGRNLRADIMYADDLLAAVKIVYCLAYNTQKIDMRHTALNNF